MIQNFQNEFTFTFHNKVEINFEKYSQINLLLLFHSEIISPSNSASTNLGSHTSPCVSHNIHTPPPSCVCSGCTFFIFTTFLPTFLTSFASLLPLCIPQYSPPKPALFLHAPPLPVTPLHNCVGGTDGCNDWTISLRDRNFASISSILLVKEVWRKPLRFSELIRVCASNNWASNNWTSNNWASNNWTSNNWTNKI